MSHVLFGNPRIQRLPLLAAVQRGLLRDGDRVTLLSDDPVDHRCMLAQGLQPLRLRGGLEPDFSRLPLRELAWRDLRLAGVDRPTPTSLDRQQRGLQRRAGTLSRLFETALPDVVVLYGARSGADRLLDLLAREFGCAVLHLGDGLLPGTLQADPRGVDGDASSCSRAAIDYRRLRADPQFVEVVLSAVLADFRPLAARGLELFGPDSIDLLASLVGAVTSGRPAATLRQLRAWRRHALHLPETEDRFHPSLLATLPRGPFVAALLQAPHDPRLRLDAGEEPPTPADVVRVAQRAALRLDPGMPVVGVLPPGGLPRGLRPAASPGLILLPGHPQVTRTCAAAAAAVATVNHPDGLVSILAGVPVLHLGATPWAVDGVATLVDRHPSGDQIDRALQTPRPALRNRFAVGLLRDEHLWCDPLRPDVNGLRGAVQAIRRTLGYGQGDAPGYVAGPAVLALDDSLDDLVAEE